MATNNNVVSSQSEAKSKRRPVNPNIQTMQRGDSFLKVRKKLYRRHFYLDKDCLTMGYNDSKKTSMNCSSGKDLSKVSVSDIVEVREGHMTDNFAKRLPKVPQKDMIEPDRCLSVIVGEDHRTLDLVAPSVDTRNAWVRGLKLLIKKMGEANLSQQQNIWMKELFKLADKNGDNTLTLKEIVGLMKHLNIEVDLETAKLRFQMADIKKDVKTKKKEDCLDIEEFILFYQMMTKREEVDELFERYNYEGQYLDSEELQEFFKDAEKQPLRLEDCAKLIQEFEPCPTVKSEVMLSIDGFHALFNAPVLDIFSQKFDHVYQDMTRPLCDYFIDSSHNTYLADDQLMGPSKVEMYIRALKRGCRCVELDCWDGHSGEPVIYHGHTLTSKISFKDAITAINTYAFEASPYPVILSIENHCSVEQQRLMAQYMISIFGDKLLKEPLPGDTMCLPSPEQLKGKIVIKGKKLKGKSSSPANGKAKKLPEDEDEGEVSDEDEAADIECDEEAVDAQLKEELSKKSKKEQKHKLAKELSDIVIICQSVSFKGFDQAKTSQNFKQMSSYGERKAKDLIDSQPGAWIEHNKRQLSRIYPAGRRTDSSNYEPMPMWLCGNQIVALNYQTPDEDMHIYKGFFLDNGGCGYILKPPFLTSPEPSTFNPKEDPPASWKKTMVLKMIAGYQFPKKKGDKKTKDILDPYVKIDAISLKKHHTDRQSKVVQNNGFHPIWNETFTFNIAVPELCMIRFRVMDHESRGRNELVAQYCVPFKCIQQGFRTIHLKTRHGEKIWGAQLLVHIDIKDG